MDAKTKAFLEKQEADTLKHELKELVDKVGGSIATSTGFGEKTEVLVDAPDGSHWVDGCVSQFVGVEDVDEGPKANLQDLIDRAKCGLEPCDAECGHLE